MQRFSVLTSVYLKDDPAKLKHSLGSLEGQTLKADEIILICDGPLSQELDVTIDSYRHKLPLRVIKLERNIGLGAVLQIGIEMCSHDLIARVDADDVNSPDRFELQIRFLDLNPHIDILGSWIREHDRDLRNITGERRVPVEHKDIFNFGKSRNPFNHMTVVFRKRAVLAAGNYRPIRFAQDYDLWARMLMKGSQGHNLPFFLVNASAGKSMLMRRGGFGYLKNEVQMLNQFHKIGYINRFQFFLNVTTRAIVRLIPNALRGQFYLRLLRKR